MNRMSWSCLAVALLACGACGSSSGSGVSGSKKLVELSPSDKDKLCSYTVDVEGGAREVDCGGGLTVTLEDKASCITDFDGLSASCTATVDDAEGCAEAEGKDPCHVDVGACSALFQCVLAGNGFR
ncbi:MAG TPA: hypothetical protein VFT22_01465 [Kofleriaceae bacterium]|nr:hypothetical protein [Kofleriaceae bacterium]